MLRITRIIKKSVIGISLLVIGSTAFGQDLNSALKMTYQEQFEAADQAFNTLIKNDPTNGKNYYYSGENQLASYFIDPVNIPFEAIAKKATERYNKGIAANPNEPLNYVGLGKVALIQKNKAVADENFAKAQSFLPVKKGKSPFSKPDQATLLVRLAEAYVQIGSKDTGLVFSLFRRAELLDSKNSELYLFRGDYWFYTLNNGSRAASDYKMSKDLSPNSTRARVRLGQLYTRIKNYQDALGYYQDALTLDPSFAPAYLEMGFLYNKTGQQDESKNNFKKYLDLSSSNIAAKRRYANMLIQTEDYKGAIEQINQIMVMDSVSFNDLNRALAFSYFEQKQYPQAKYYISKFFANAPIDKVTEKDYTYYGRILLKNNLDSLGIIQLNKAFTYDSTNIDLLNEIATLYNKTKKFQNAGDTYKLKLALTKGNVNDYIKMGRAYFDAKNWTESDSAYAKVSRMNPDYEPAYVFRARIYSNLDPNSTAGLAKPFYDLVLEKAASDSVKYQKDIIEAYSYLGYYSYLNKLYCESLGYWDKINILDPANKTAIDAMKDMKSLCPEFKPTNPQP